MTRLNRSPAITHKLPKSASQAVISRVQLILQSAHRAPHGALRLVQAMSAWSVKTRRAPTRHRRDARVSMNMAISPRPCMTISTPPPVVTSYLVLHHLHHLMELVLKEARVPSNQRSAYRVLQGKRVQLFPCCTCLPCPPSTPGTASAGRPGCLRGHQKHIDIYCCILYGV